MIRVAIAGDFCATNRLENLIQNREYDRILSSAKCFFSEFDLSVVNLEAPIATPSSLPIKKDGPCLKCSEESVEALHYAGVGLVTLANNHLGDYGPESVMNTMNICRKHEVETVGAGKNKEDAAAIKYISVKDRVLAFINCCEHEFSIATTNTPGANHLGTIPIYYSIKEARKMADYVILITHGGHEHYQLPSPRMKELYRFFVDAGADAVINHHQHCISGYEIYNDKPIAYGIGNFCFDENNTHGDTWSIGMIACLNLEDKNISLSFQPFIQCDDLPTIEFRTDITQTALSQVESLSKIIADDNTLLQSYQVFLQPKERTYMNIFEPYGGYVLSALYRRKLLPSIVGVKKHIRNYGFVFCESHFDIVKYWLSKKRGQ